MSALITTLDDPCTCISFIVYHLFLCNLYAVMIWPPQIMNLIILSHDLIITFHDLTILLHDLNHLFHSLTISVSQQVDCSFWLLMHKKKKKCYIGQHVLFWIDVVFYKILNVEVWFVVHVITQPFFFFFNLTLSLQNNCGRADRCRRPVQVDVRSSQSERDEEGKINLVPIFSSTPLSTPEGDVVIHHDLAAFPAPTPV